MEKTVPLDASPISDAEYEAVSNLYLAKINLLQQQMDEDRREIIAMRTETDAMLANIMHLVKAA